MRDIKQHGIPSGESMDSDFANSVVPTQSDRSHLKPCPYCDGPARLDPMPGTNYLWWRVRCRDFGCGGTTWAFQSKDGAIAAWNRRGRS